MPLSTRFSGLSFRLEEKGSAHVEGYIDENVLTRVVSPEELLKTADSFLNRFAPSPPDVQKKELREELKDDLANFLFISALMDYGNIGTSETLSLHLRGLYRKHPFLFRPADPFWRKLEDMDQETSSKVLSSILMPISGLFRTDFENVVVPNWVNIIRFLHEKCNDDASNFFIHMIRSLFIDRDDPLALASFQNLLRRSRDRDRLKQQLGINFALGPKTGLLLLSVMTDNRRGFGVLRGVRRDQVRGLKAPIDSAVIRVMLNTGLVKITSINPKRREGRFTRTDMTDVCQRAMDLFAERLGILPIELDMYIWAVGTIPCKHRGRFCFICPLMELCDSWMYGYVKESSGAEYLKRCFSFARPQTAKNALYLRGCRTCPQRSLCRIIDDSTKIRHPTWGLAYTSRRYSESLEKLPVEEIGGLIETQMGP